MNISSLISTTGLIDKAFTQPVMRIKPRSAKRPDIETALKSVVNQIETEVTSEISAAVALVLQEEYDAYVTINGEHADSATKNDWESGMDDVVEKTIEPWNEHLSANWLGVNTIGSALHLKEGVGLFCNKLGREYFKQLTHDKTAAQIMSSAGILRADVEAALDKHINPTDEEKEDMADKQESELQDVIDKIAAHIGKDHDVMTVYDDLGLVTDGDELLAAGAAPRLGIDEADAAVLQGESLMYGEDTPDVLQKMIQEVLDGTAKPKKAKGKMTRAANLAKGEDPGIGEEIVPPAKPQNKGQALAAARAAKKAKAAAAKDEDGDEAAELEGLFNPKVLSALRDNGAVDIDMATGIGVSRATYNNYVNGKAAFEPDAEQAGYIRDQIVSRINSLHEALALVDGTEPEMVF